MIYHRLIYNSIVYSDSWENAITSSAGNTVFYYEFNNNTNDLSGNGYDATITGTISYTEDDPALGGGFSANVTGNTSGQIPVDSLGSITGDHSFSVIGVVKVPASGFGNNILWMGGSDSFDANDHQAFSISFFGSDTDPKVGVDFARFTIQYSIDTSLIDSWMTVINQYDSSTGEVSVYVAPQGGTFTRVGTTSTTMNFQTGRNWLFAWGGDGSGGGNPIRRFIGACAFLALKDTALSAIDRNRFLIPA